MTLTVGRESSAVKIFWRLRDKTRGGEIELGDELTLGAGTVLRYEVEGAPAGARPGAAPRAESPAPTPPARPGATSFWRRRPKLVLGGLAYLVALAALAAFLATRKKARAPEKLPLLTRDQIEADLLKEITRPPDPRRARRALERAMDLYERRYVNPANLYAAITAFKEAEAYLGTSLSKPEHIKAFDQAVRELVDTLDRLYFQAVGLQHLGRYDEARDVYARILQYVSDPDSAVYRNVSRRIKALKPFLSKPRWSKP